MRFDKLTTKFQQALADAQSLALGNDNGFVEPAAPALGAAQAGGWRNVVAALPRRCQRSRAKGRAGQGNRAPAEGRRPGRRDHCLARPDQPAQPHRQDRRQARRPVHRQRVVPAGARRRQGRDRAPAQGPRPDQEGAGSGDRRGARRRQRRLAGGRGPARGAEEVHDRPHRARAPGQARPGDRPRRRDPPHDPDPAAAHQEQSRC